MALLHLLLVRRLWHRPCAGKAEPDCSIARDGYGALGNGNNGSKSEYGIWEIQTVRFPEPIESSLETQVNISTGAGKRFCHPAATRCECVNTCATAGSRAC